MQIPRRACVTIIVLAGVTTSGLEAVAQGIGAAPIRRPAIIAQQTYQYLAPVDSAATQKSPATQDCETQPLWFAKDARDASCLWGSAGFQAFDQGNVTGGGGSGVAAFAGPNLTVWLLHFEIGAAYSSGSQATAPAQLLLSGGGAPSLSAAYVPARVNVSLFHLTPVLDARSGANIPSLGGLRHASAFNEDLGGELRADVDLKKNIVTFVVTGRAGDVFGSGSAFRLAGLPTAGRFAYDDYFVGLQFSTCMQAGVSRVLGGPRSALRIGTQVSVTFIPCGLKF